MALSKPSDCKFWMLSSFTLSNFFLIFGHVDQTLWSLRSQGNDFRVHGLKWTNGTSDHYQISYTESIAVKIKASKRCGK